MLNNIKKSVLRDVFIRALGYKFLPMSAFLQKQRHCLKYDRIRAFSGGKIRVKENLFSGIFYAIGVSLAPVYEFYLFFQFF